jgi:DNA-binding SARP family transcriptional activator/DNA-binding beta-propeller fold protein YncE
VAVRSAFLFRTLGPLEVDAAGRRVQLGGPRQRALLAILVLNCGEVVSIDRLVDGIWGDNAPASARHLVQVYVSQLRMALAGDVPLATRSPGYALEADPEQVDAVRFERLLGEGRRLRDERRWAEAWEAFCQGTELWRGRILSDVPLEGEAAIQAARLEELRYVALEERVDAALALGKRGELVPELEELVAAEPLRERFRAQLMLALYGSGRQAAALAAYREARRHLSEQLGIEPTPTLQKLELAILRHDPELELPQQPQTAEPRARPASSRRRRLIVAGAAGVATLMAAGMLALLAMDDDGEFHSLPPQSVGVVDAGSGKIEQRIEVGGFPGPIALSEGIAWVANAPDRSVTAIDRRTDRVARRIGVGTVPYRLAARGDLLWVANGYDGTLKRIDLRNGLVSRGLRAEPRATGRLALATDDGSLWVASQDNVVARLDVETGRLVARIRALPKPEALAVGAGGVWVAAATAATVARIDPRTNRVTRSIPIGGIPSAIATDARNVWVVTPAEGLLWRIESRTNSVTARIAVGANPTAVVVADGSVWVALGAVGTLVRVDPRRGTVAQKVRLGRPIGGLAAQHGRLWVSVR